MSDKELIKQEIERLQKEVYNHDFAIDYSANGALDRVVRFIDSLTEEPANKDLDFLVISLEETIGTSPHSREVIKEHLQRAAEWGRNHIEDKSEMVSEDLEEAADEYAENHGFRVPYDGSNKFYDDVDVKASKEGFIAGAAWQKNKDQETIELAEDHAMLACMNRMKEEMMKDAIESIVEDWCGDSPEITIPLNPQDFKTGDKVKIIIVKEE